MTDNRKLGPVADILLKSHAGTFQRVVLLHDQKVGREAEGKDYQDWLRRQLQAARRSIVVDLEDIAKRHGDDPTNFQWVYDVMRRIIAASEADNSAVNRHYLVGPGTPTMSACTLLLSRLAACKGKVWQSDIKSEQGYRPLQLPFELAMKDGVDPASQGQEDEVLDPQSGDVIVKSPSTVRAWELAIRAAKSRWPVLILGSTGSGKEELFKHLFTCSDLKGKRLSLNCGAIPESLVESKLFGSMKGAFTGATKDTLGIFEEAEGGMVFLDEVGELPHFAQTRLLRVLQEKKVTRVGEHKDRDIQCRIVAATHRNLWQAVQKGNFREDLYYRLAGIILELDDLVRRPEDLEEMIDRFWHHTTKENPGFPGRELTAEARQKLLAHGWPGNVRELKATLVRSAFLATGPLVSPADVDLALTKTGALPVDPPLGVGATMIPPRIAPAMGEDLKTQMKHFQRQQVADALARHGGNKTRTARELDISPQHLGRILKG